MGVKQESETQMKIIYSGVSDPSSLSTTYSRGILTNLARAGFGRLVARLSTLAHVIVNFELRVARRMVESLLFYHKSDIEGREKLIKVWA